MQIYQELSQVKSLLLQNDLETALHLADSLCQIYDDHAHALSVKATVLYRLGQKEQAIECLALAIEHAEAVDEQLIVDCFTQMYHLINSSRFAEALTYAELVVKFELEMQRDDFTDSSLFFAAWCHFYLGDYQQASVAIKQISDPLCDREFFLSKLHTLNELKLQLSASLH
ncbi:hypothetical protein HR060_13305 [Catenovulum sp. SM1970]|uniref:hypothetical protein n=1 Tax=Marinifaba aquimaris TaxID=2741323 RepID=UPI001571835F|nr:hypothetical protein [Marinifaba aquimaris]NTS77831.1 hypothetical protein [Marinifaba aquimaris]